MKIGEVPRSFIPAGLAHRLPAVPGMIPAETAPSYDTTSVDCAALHTPISLDDRLRELEASLISWALDATGGNKSQAARLLQLKRSTLGDRIARCKLDERECLKSEV